MQQKNQHNRSRKITIRLSSEEYSKLQERFKETIYRKFSEYLRNKLNDKPITVRYRNQSADEFLVVAIRIKNELTAIGNNLNQAVKNLHQIQAKTDLHQTVENLEANLFDLQQKANEIKFEMNQIYQQWLQK